MSLLSVVIPVFKVESYLQECVDSVLSQTYTDIEVILVDDGSPDSCPDICDDYALSDHRVRVIHQTNQGLSAARNAGIEAAQGEFIAFVDSDDYVSPNYFQVAMELLNKISDLDIAEMPMISRFNTKETVRYAAATTTIIRGQENLWSEWFARQGYLHAYSQLKVARRQVFESVRFPLGKTFEDLHVIPQLMKQCRAIAYVAHPTANYFYRWRNESITAQTRWADLDSQISAIQEISQLADSYNNISQHDWANFSMAASNLLIDTIKAARNEQCDAKLNEYTPLLRIIQAHKPTIPVALSLHEGWRTTLKATLLSCLNIRSYLRLLA